MIREKRLFPYLHCKRIAYLVLLFFCGNCKYVVKDGVAFFFLKKKEDIAKYSKTIFILICLKIILTYRAIILNLYISLVHSLFALPHASWAFSIQIKHVWTKTCMNFGDSGWQKNRGTSRIL